MIGVNIYIKRGIVGFCVGCIGSFGEVECDVKIVNNG